MSNDIDSSQISVVIQGAVDRRCIHHVLCGVRKFLPNSELILSTWEGTPTYGYDFDRIVFSKDVGATKDPRTGIPNNLNRQICSTLNGLKACSRKYALKLRSDLVLTSSNFLKYFNKYQEREASFSFFSNRVIFTSYFFKRFWGTEVYGIHPCPFHISDWLMFGELRDIKKLFDIPYATEPEFSHWQVNHPELCRINMNGFGASYRMAPEQYILYEFLKKVCTHLPKYEHIMDFSSENIVFFDRFVASNCIILDPNQFSVFCSKNDGTDPYYQWSTNLSSLPYIIYQGLFTHYQFELVYKKYCDNSHTIASSLIKQEKNIRRKNIQEILR